MNFYFTITSVISLWFSQWSVGVEISDFKWECGISKSLMSLISLFLYLSLSRSLSLSLCLSLFISLFISFSLSLSSSLSLYLSLFISLSSSLSSSLSLSLSLSLLCLQSKFNANVLIALFSLCRICKRITGNYIFTITSILPCSTSVCPWSVTTWPWPN